MNLCTREKLAHVKCGFDSLIEAFLEKRVKSCSESLFDVTQTVHTSRSSQSEVPLHMYVHVGPI